MSGITPLIDTLLHQVLGRQGELSLQRALSQPVKPVSPGEGPRAVMGDANLDGRASTSPLGDLKRLPHPLDGGRTLPRGEAQPSPSGSTQTHFSPAARTIADVLLRFPAPPSVMRPEAPLITSQEAPAASTVATRLEASIRDSGLFYESHLKRWFQGSAFDGVCLVYSCLSWGATDSTNAYAVSWSAPDSTGAYAGGGGSAFGSSPGRAGRHGYFTQRAASACYS